MDCLNKFLFFCRIWKLCRFCAEQHDYRCGNREMEQHAYGFREGDVRVNAFVYAYMRSFSKLIDVW